MLVPKKMSAKIIIFQGKTSFEQEPLFIPNFQTLIPFLRNIYLYFLHLEFLIIIYQY